MLTIYRVTLTHCVIEVMAYSRGHAITSALELAGPGAKVMSCIRQGEW